MPSDAVSTSLIICSMVAILVGVVSMATPHWVKDGPLTEGLWQLCDADQCYNINTFRDIEDWLYVARAFAVMSCIFSLFTGFCVFLYDYQWLSSEGLKVKNIIILTAFSCISALFMLIGAVTYGASSSGKVSYSFAFSFVAVLFSLITAIHSVKIFYSGRLQQLDPPEGAERF